MDIYDIVRLSGTDNEDLDGKSAFVTRVRISTSDTYDLFFPGDDHTDPAFLTYNELVPEKGNVKNVIISETHKNPYKTLSETLNLAKDSLLVGVHKSDPKKTDPLKVIRFTDDTIVVTRTNDPTEEVIEIPLQNGIAVGSIYGFLQPAIVHDDDETEPEVSPEKQAFIERMNEIPELKVIYTKTPVIKERTEIPVIGGTHDINRLTGQLVSAIRAIDTTDKTDNTRIQSLIKDTTLYNGTERIIINQDEPIMLRAKMPIPPWVLPVDGSRSSGINVASSKKPDHAVDENDINRKMPFHLFNRITGSGLRIPPAKGSDLQEIKSRTEVIVGLDTAIPTDKLFQNNPHAYTGEIYKKRILLPIMLNHSSKTPVKASFRDPDYYKPTSVLVLPHNTYSPDSGDLIHKLHETPWLSDPVINPDEIVGSSVPLTNTIIRTPYSLSRDEFASDTHMLASVSPTIEAILSLPMRYASLEEIGSKGVAYGYNKHGILTHDERVIASAYLKIASERLVTQLASKDATVPIYSVSPKGLYKELKDLHTLYPNTLGIIGNEEALDRVIQTENDFGKVLMGMLGADEYTSMDTQIRDILKSSEGNRTRIREQMAEIQGRLRELEDTLRTLPKIAKHYGSRKEVEKAKGTIPLWDEHLDDDPDKNLYYSDRFRKIVGKVLNDMQISGELDEIVRNNTSKEQGQGGDASTATAAAAAASLVGEDASKEEKWNTEDIIRKIPSKRLEDAVREDLNRYNLTIGESARLTGDRFETIVQRVILGGRPVKNGDIALITRHLRTAAYKWDDKNAKWIALRDDEPIFAGNDPSPNPNPTKIFTQTLHLNKEYRQLSKTKDDLEMIAKRPDMMADPDKLAASLDSLIDSVSERANTRIAYLQRNRVIDEIPFLYDRSKYVSQRYSYEQESIPEDGEPPSRITRSEMKKARLHAVLETDMDLDLFEAGYGAMGEDLKKSKKGERFASVGEIRSTDPILKMTNERNGPATFISEVSGRDRIVRVYLSAIGFMETLLRTPLTQQEIIMCVKDVGSILHVKSTSRDAIQRGITMYCAIVCTRMNSRVLIPKTDGETPPPTQDTLPSYRVPFLQSEPNGLLTFIVKVLNKVAKKSVEGRSTTTFSVILKNIGKVGLTTSREESENNKAITRFRDILSRISKTTPSLITRVLQVRSTKIEQSDTEKGLRISNKWESVPIVHNPHPESGIVQTSRHLLKDTELLRKDAQGEPYPANSGLSLPIFTPELKTVLEEIHNTYSEKLQELLYSRYDKSLALNQSLVITSPSPAFIGVLRERILTTPLSEAEAPKTSYVTPDSIIPIPGESEGVNKRAKELLGTLIQEVLQDGDIGIIGRGSTRPLDVMNEELRSPEDLNGALKSGLIAYNDAVIIATEQYIRTLQSIEEPVSCEQNLYNKEYKNYPSQSRQVPVYTCREIVKGLMSGVSPLMIEYSKSTIKSGGSRNTVLTGSQTYFARITDIVSILDEIRVRNVDRIKDLQGIAVRIREELSNTHDTISNDLFMDIMYKSLNEGSDKEEMLLSIELYITILAHTSDIFSRTRATSLVHTDVNDTILDEELNYDRERERQRFIYQLDDLDDERRDLAKASRALGVDLAGTIARDPRKFNAEYYEMVNSLVATQEMQDSAPEIAGRYGDQQDLAWDRDAMDGAFEGVEQIEGLDYD
jgi:hypothetical protein